MAGDEEEVGLPGAPFVQNAVVFVCQVVGGGYGVYVYFEVALQGSPKGGYGPAAEFVAIALSIALVTMGDENFEAIFLQLSM